MEEKKEWDGKDRRLHCADHCETMKRMKGMVQWRVFAGAMGAVVAGVAIFATIYSSSIGGFEDSIKNGFDRVRTTHDKDIVVFRNEYLRDVQQFYKMAQENGAELKRASSERARIIALQEVVLRTIDIGNGDDKRRGRP